MKKEEMIEEIEHKIKEEEEVAKNHTERAERLLKEAREISKKR